MGDRADMAAPRNEEVGRGVITTMRSRSDLPHPRCGNRLKISCTRECLETSKLPNGGQIEPMVESRRETNPIASRRHLFPVLARRNGCPNQCAKTGTDECAKAGYRSGAHNVTVSAAVAQCAAHSTDAGADAGADRRIDASGAGAVAHVQPRNFFAQY